METLPDPLISEIMYYLQPHQAFCSYNLTCKFIYESLNNPYTLCQYFSYYIGMPYCVRLPPNQTLQHLKHLTQTSKHPKLRFQGVSTNGGVDQDSHIYWVENLYTKVRGGYCSFQDKLNINTLGVLFQALQDSQTKIQARKQFLNYMRNNRIFRQIARPEFIPQQDKLDQNLEGILHNLWNVYSQHFLNDESEEKRAETREKVKQILQKAYERPQTLYSYRRYINDRYVLEKPFRIKENVKFVSNKLVFSREGGFTCPVQTFMVFISQQPVDVQDQQLGIYNDLYQVEQVDRMASFFSLKVSPTLQQEGIQYKIFSKTSRKIQPLLWGKFDRLSEKNTIKVDLGRYFSGVSLLTKLINPENLMQQRGDNHDLCNIDAKYVGLKGIVFNFNQWIHLNI